MSLSSSAGFTGADLQNLMNEAAILAARRNLQEISKEEISDALEKIIAGPEKKGAVVSDAKKKLVAYHEVRFPLHRRRRCQANVVWLFSCPLKAMVNFLKHRHISNEYSANK